MHERAATVGGKLGRYERDGFRFDTGPSLLTLPQVFADLGLDARPGAAGPGGAARLPGRHGARLVVRPGRLRGTGSRTRSAPARPPTGPRFWRRAERIWDASWRLGAATRRSPRRRWPRLSWRRRRPGRDRARAVAARAGPPLPARPAAADAARPVRDLHRRRPAPRPGRPGRHPLRGAGLRRLVPARRPRHARRRRCWPAAPPSASTSHTSSAGRPAIDAAAGRVTGVPAGLRRRIVPADVVVANVDALTVYRDLLPTPARLAALADRSLAGFVLLLGVRGDTPQLAHHTVFFPRDYDAEFDAVFGSPGRRRPARLRPDRSSSPAPTDPSVHPPGAEAWFVLVNAPRHGTAPAAVDWRRPGLADAYAAHILDVLAARGAGRAGPAGVLRDAHAGRPGGRRRRRRAGRSTARPAACCARRTGARSTGCSWSAARRTRAAACRWSPCPPRSSPTRSARPSSACGTGRPAEVGSARRGPRGWAGGRPRRARRGGPSPAPATGVPRSPGNPAGRGRRRSAGSAR